jgi:hypothetical protein
MMLREKFNATSSALLAASAKQDPQVRADFIVAPEQHG